MEFISTEQDGAVAVVTIDHPPVNALSAGLLEELEGELDRLDADTEARAVVLRGAGERAFVAGADISEFPTLRDAGSDNGGSARGMVVVGLAATRCTSAAPTASIYSTRARPSSRCSRRRYCWPPSPYGR